MSKLGQRPIYCRGWAIIFAKPSNGCGANPPGIRPSQLLLALKQLNLELVVCTWLIWQTHIDSMVHGAVPNLPTDSHQEAS